MCTSKSSAESAEVTERNSSRTGNDEPEGFVDDNQDDEKMEGPNGFVRPEDGKVSEPDLRRLLRSTIPTGVLVVVAAVTEVAE